MSTDTVRAASVDCTHILQRRKLRTMLYSQGCGIEHGSVDISRYLGFGRAHLSKSENVQDTLLTSSLYGSLHSTIPRYLQRIVFPRDLVKRKMAYRLSENRV